jgi:hypothetical protein
LRKVALALPDVEEVVACKGTTVESASFRVRGKAFLFLRPATAMVKLDRSKDEAAKLSAREPTGCKVGSGGWATVSILPPQPASLAQWKRWIAESHALFAAPKSPTPRKKKSS